MSSPSITESKGPELIDIYTFHERRAGRLVLEPSAARLEFGEEFASRLKTTPDGSTILWPQPTDDPEDPLNWSDQRKDRQLLLLMLVSIIPNLDSGIGIAALFPVAKQYHITTGEVNNISTNWSLFLLSWGGIFVVLFARRYGRLPVLFWTQLFALGFLVGETFAPSFPVFAAMRCLNAFFAACPLVTGLYTITDLYPFHLRVRKINMWTMAVILSPHISPFVFGFLVDRSWRWAFGIGCIYGAIMLALIVVFMEETMYDRSIPHAPRKPGFATRLKDLVGITGVQAKWRRPSWSQVIFDPLRIAWRLDILGILLFAAIVSGFSIGINVTNTVLLQNPRPKGYGLTQNQASGVYATPVVFSFVGEFVGRYLNDFVMNLYIRQHGGVFEAEARLWVCYVGITLYVAGFVLLGGSLQHHLHIALVVVGWAITQVGILVTTVPIYAYASDCLPHNQGEISALLGFVRILGGFSVSYYQVPWASKHGALQTLGVEAAIVAGLCITILPLVQWKGHTIRKRFQINS